MRIRKFCASSVEWKYIYHLMESIEDVHIRNYVANQIEWYVIKASWYKILEYTLKFLTVIMPTVVVIVHQCLDENDIVAQIVVLGGATVTSASGAFLKLHDKRVLYRKTAEQIKEETSLFINRVSPYDKEDCEKYFVMNLHEIVTNTNSKWGEIEEEDKETKDKPPTK